VAAQRIVNRLLRTQKLKEKYERTIQQLEKKNKEMKPEIESLQKTLTENEQAVKESVATVEAELSKKLNAKVRVAL